MSDASHDIDEEYRKRHLEMAEEIDGLDRDVTSWEADFLESILKRLREGRSLTAKQADVLEGMYEKYVDEPAKFDEDSAKD